MTDFCADGQAFPADPLVEGALVPGPSLAQPGEAGELGPEAAPVTE
jgi:hypothetical protein